MPLNHGLPTQEREEKRAKRADGSHWPAPARISVRGGFAAQIYFYDFRGLVEGAMGGNVSAAQKVGGCLKPENMRRTWLVIPQLWMPRSGWSDVLIRWNKAILADQISKSTSLFLRSALLMTFTLTSSWRTSERGGTLCMRKTLAPMVLPAPITVSPPTMVALA